MAGSMRNPQPVLIFKNRSVGNPGYVAVWFPIVCKNKWTQTAVVEVELVFEGKRFKKRTLYELQTVVSSYTAEVFYKVG